MRRLSTKADRLAVQAGNISRRTANGYELTEYKGLQILTKDEGGKYFLQVYKDTASEPIANYYYTQVERRAQKIEDLKKSYDYRQTRKAEERANPRKSTAANAAAAIKEELTSIFKGIKFSVRSENFAGGNSVHISWSDGPTAEQVEVFTDKYQYGHFNGMEDIYENSNSREDIPQAKYVSTSRDLSEETRAAINAAAETIYQENKKFWENSMIWNAENLAYQIAYQCTIPAGAKVLGLKEQHTDGHGPASMYTLDIEETATAPAEIETTTAPAGTIQIIEHPIRPAKFLVIGETRPIKEELKKLGGWWNRFETGWEFKKSELDKVANYLRGLKAPDPETIPEELTTDEAEAIAAVQAERPRLQEEEVKTYDSLQDIEEAAQSGKVISLMNLHTLVNEKPKHPALKEEVKKTIEFFRETGTPEHEIKRMEEVQCVIIERKPEKNGRSNTALPAPQMFISF